MTNQPADTSSLAGHRKLCRKCAYLVDGDICPECGDNPCSRTELLKRAGSIGRISRLLMVALVLEITTILFVSLSGGQIWGLISMGPGIIGMVLMLVLVVAIIFSPGILAASAAIRVAGNQWNLSRRNKMLIRATALVFLVLPVKHLFLPAMYLGDYLGLSFVPYDTFSKAAGWFSMVYSFALMGAVAILLRAIGICSRHDPGGDERRFLRYAWIGALGLAIIHEVTVLAGIQGGIYMELTGLQFHAGLNFHDGVGKVDSWMIGMIITVIFMIYLLACVRCLYPWRKMLVRCAKEAESA